jgi:mono/diheme cytochrome c family protein
MSRRWKIFLAVILAIPVLLFAGSAALIGKAFGRKAVWEFTAGTFLGTRARPLTNRTFQPTPARLERGKYLAEGVLVCFACHSEHDPQTRLPLPGKLGAGRSDPDFPRPVLTALIYPNITPDPETGAGTWTDDMLARAIREGVGHDGRPLIGVMPYKSFRNLTDEDLASVVVYLRTIPPVFNPLPKMKAKFPFNLLAKSSPQPLNTPLPQRDLSDSVKRGEYLTKIAECFVCHEGHDQNGHSLPFGGGGLFNVDPSGAPRFSGVPVAAANLTSDPSGISYYDEATFIRALRTGRVGARELRVMPWRPFGKMSDEDLGAIFAYLRTVKPVKHRVDNTEPPTYCKICGRTHGGGAQN